MERIYGTNTFVANDNGEMGYTWRPTFEEESLHGAREVELRTRHFTDRKIFIQGEVSDTMANDFVSQMMFLCKSDFPIDIYINSPGGSVSAGLCIYSTIRAAIEKGIEVNMYATVSAASMGAIIFAAGEKGHRFMLPYAKLMIHEPLIGGSGVSGSATTIKTVSDNILETKAKLAKILAERSGRSLEEVNEAISYDHYMTPDEAIEWGLCDEVRNVI